MERANIFDVENHPALETLCTVTCVHWNKLNHRRLDAYHDEDGDVWDVNYTDLYHEFKPVVGGSTAQQLRRENDKAWRNFFDQLSKYHNDTNESVTDKPSPPGYWGNRDDGYEEHWNVFIEAGAYTVEWGERSRLEILVGSELKEEYGLGKRERLRLEIRGDPKWSGDDGQIQITYDSVREQFTVIHPVTVTDPAQHRDDVVAQEDTRTPSESSGLEEAAVDLGANNLAAVTTTTGTQFCYDGQQLFERFREQTEHIAAEQAKLPAGVDWSEVLSWLSRQKYEHRDHARDALVRNLVDRLHSDGVGKLYVGKLAGVLETYWSCEVNEKTHQFWAFAQFTERLKDVCEEYGITVDVVSEAWTTQMCPQCGERDETVRCGRDFHCSRCHWEGHADIDASHKFLAEQTDKEIAGPMARPVHLTWDNHEWRIDQSSPPLSGANPSEDWQTRYRRNWRDVASGTSVAGCASE
jgi:putative transposase